MARAPLGVETRFPATLWLAVLNRACDIYAREFGTGAGRIPATFEMIFLTGWSPDESQPQPLRPGSAKARLADALGAEEKPLKD